MNQDERERRQKNNLIQTMHGNFFQSTTHNLYMEKIEVSKKEAQEYEKKLKELEQKELSLLSKLQMTQMIERSEIQKLSAIKSKKIDIKSYHSQGSINRNQEDDQDLDMVREVDNEQDIAVGAVHLNPKPLVLTGPSGAGKSTLTNYIMKHLKEKFAFSVSYTTRSPRQGEQDGVHYNFISKEEFEGKITQGDLLEYNEVHGNYYGTSKTQVKAI